jgi:hypothetical protein
VLSRRRSVVSGGLRILGRRGGRDPAPAASGACQRRERCFKRGGLTVAFPHRAACIISLSRPRASASAGIRRSGYVQEDDLER